MNGKTFACTVACSEQYSIIKTSFNAENITATGFICCSLLLKFYYTLFTTLKCATIQTTVQRLSEDRIRTKVLLKYPQQSDLFNGLAFIFFGALLDEMNVALYTILSSNTLNTFWKQKLNTKKRNYVMFQISDPRDLYRWTMEFNSPEYLRIQDK